MTDKKKPELKIVKDRPEILTAKQRAFVDEIVKGKLDTQIDCYMKIYNVARTKTGAIPKHAHVDCSKLISNPKVNLAIRRGLQRKETGAVASGIRTKNYVLERLMAESRDAESDASRIRSLELLGKTIGLFTDVIEERKERDSELIAEEIEDKIIKLLEESQSD